MRSHGKISIFSLRLSHTKIKKNELYRYPNIEKERRFQRQNIWYVIHGSPMLEPRSGYSSLQTKNNMWVFIFTHITQKKEAIQEDLSKYMN